MIEDKEFLNDLCSLMTDLQQFTIYGMLNDYITKDEGKVILTCNCVLKDIYERGNQ